MTSLGLGIGIGIIHPRSASARALSAANSIFGAGNVLTWGILDDAPIGIVQSIPLRVGVVASPKSTARATAAEVLGKTAAVFSADAAGMGYVMRTGAKTQIAVARWDGALPFPNYNGLLTSNEIPGLIGNLGASSFFTHGTVYRDGTATYTVDTSPHYWVSASASTTVAEVLLGNAINNPLLNWIGPVWHVCQLSTAATPAQISSYGAALKQLYPFLP
jgi:hypothetical protein